MKKSLALCAFALLTLTACHSSKSKFSQTQVETASVHETTIERSTNAVDVKLILKDYVMRAPAGVNTNTAAYLTVVNKGNVADRLTGVSCACAASATLHTTTTVNGMMQMDEVPGFDIPAGGTLTLAPGGNHIMISGLTDHPKDGDAETLTFTFVKAGTITVKAPVSNDPSRKSDDMAGMKM